MGLSGARWSPSPGTEPPTRWWSATSTTTASPTWVLRACVCPSSAALSARYTAWLATAMEHSATRLISLQQRFAPTSWQSVISTWTVTWIWPLRIFAWTRLAARTPRWLCSRGQGKGTFKVLCFTPTEERARIFSPLLTLTATAILIW